MTLAERIAQNIKRLRLEKNLTQAAVADAAGVARATMNRWEGTDASAMTLKDLEAIAKFLGKTPVELIQGPMAVPAQPALSVAPSPELYEFLFLANAMTAEIRDHFLKLMRARLGRGVVNDQSGNSGANSR